MTKVRVVGMDPSFSNWGVAVGQLDVWTGILELSGLYTIRPSKITSKQVRTSSKDLDRVHQLVAGCLPHLKGSQATFVEVPVGSQSAAAMKGYGACIGALASLQVMGHPFIELSPNDIKLAGHGTKTATKTQMIEWAVERHPEAPWPMQTKKGVESVVATQAEHMADAIAAIYAGVKTPDFQRMLPILRRAA